MTLDDLVGLDASTADLEAGYWKQVPRWVMGGNDDPNIGDCAFVALANLHDLVTTVNGAAEIMSDGEVQHAYSRIAGWLPGQPETNRGAVPENVLRYWVDQGWPGDPEMRPAGWCEIEEDEIHQAVHSLGGVYAWCMLPLDEDEQWDWTDDAVLGAAQGVGAHAVLIVGSTSDTLWIVSWARVFEVSRSWWRVYGKGAYAVRHPSWMVP